MMNRRDAPIALAILLCLLCPGISIAASPNSSKPNMILVMADDQGWGDTASNGHPFVQTPALDAMAEDGFVFDRFYAGAPVCSPTRASVMTGRNPIRTKVTNHGRYMRPHEQTIAETLKAAGYREITLLDQQVGRLRAAIREMGIADNTIVWYCSDSGGLVKESSGGREKKGSIYEGGLRVPAIIEWPARKLRGRTSVPVANAQRHRRVPAVSGRHHDRACRLDRLAVEAASHQRHRINGKRFELYKLSDDPMETADLSKDPRHTQQLERMKKELDAWMRSVVRNLNGKDY